MEYKEIQLIDKNNAPLMPITSTSQVYTVEGELLQDELTNHETRIEALEQGGGGGGSTVTIADNPTGGVDLTVNGTTKTLANQSSLAGLDVRINTNAEEISTAENNIVRLGGTVDELETEVSTVKSDLNELDNNKVDKTQVATNTSLGLTQGWSTGGITVGADGSLRTYMAQDNDLTRRSNDYRPIVSKNLDKAVRLAMTDGKGAEWTEAEKANARARMGINTLELIEEINIDSDSPFSVTRTTEPNGTPYKFKGVRVVLFIEPNSTVGNYGQVFLYTNGSYIANFEMGTLSAQTVRFYAYGAFESMNYAMYTRFISVGSGMSTLYHRVPTDFLFDSSSFVDRIDFPPITGKAKIRIYGVRA